MKYDLARLLAAAARRRGWEIERTRGSHWKLRHPGGGMVIASSTPSRPSALANLKSDLRRIERRTTP